MTSIVRRLDLPLVGKELAELAMKRRTYVLRVIYAVTLFAIFLGVFLETVSSAVGSRTDWLGSGRMMFGILVQLQTAGIIVFLPGMVAGAIPLERERGALELLLLTRLTPTTIVLQKLISRILPMVTFLLLALPLMALTMTLGGVSWLDLLDGAVMLLLACVIVGSLSIVFSAACKTTVMAMLLTYVAIFMFSMTCLPCISFAVLGYAVGAMDPSVDMVWRLGRLSGTAVVTGVVFGICMVLARHFLLTQRMAYEKPAALKAFQGFDEFMDRVNRVAGGVTLLKGAGSLPEDRPIHWRETTRNVLGNWKYLGRIGLALMGLAALVCIPLAYTRDEGTTWPITVGLIMAWPLVVLVVSMMSCNAFAGERASQTLESLLTTPMSTARIVRDKLTAIHRIVFVLALPYFVFVVTKGYVVAGRRSYSWDYYDGNWGTGAGVGYTVTALMAFVVYMLLVIWVPLAVGLTSRSRGVATLRVLVMLGAATFGPLVITLLLSLLEFSEEVCGLVAGMSPMVLLYWNEGMSLDDIYDPPFVFVVANLVIYGMIALGAMLYCSSKADKLLGRVDE